MSWASVKQALARQTFHYDPLDLVEKQIRLLILYGSHPDAPHSGQAELRIVTLGTGTSYEALSYQWGTSQADQSIIINDQPKAITPNLALALRCLRLEMRERVLWVDAICIDQKNLKEKSNQVQMMNRIYLQAQEVLIWLGRPGPSLDGKQHDERQAFDTIKRIASAVRERGEGDVSYDASSMFNFDELSSLWHLCTREYWTRIWIIQEVGLAARATIYCCYDKLSERDHGEDVLSAPWDDFLATTREMRKPWLYAGGAIHLSKEEILEAITHSLPAQLDERKRDLAGQLTLYDLLSISQDSKSQKRQDRVFGLLGLSNDCEGKLLADYRQSPHAVYRSVMEFYHAESKVGLFDAAKMIKLSRVLLQNLGLKSEVWWRWRSTRSDHVFEIPGMLTGAIEGLCPAIEKDSRYFALPDELLERHTSDMLRRRWLLSIVENPVKRYLPRLQQSFKFNKISICSRSSTAGSKGDPGPRKSEAEEQLVDRVMHDSAAQFFVTDTRNLGLAFMPLSEEDVICQFQGCDLSLVLRGSSDTSYSVLGMALFWTFIESPISPRVGSIGQWVSAFPIPDHPNQSFPDNMVLCKMDLGTLRRWSSL